MTPISCSLCGQQLIMGIAHNCQKQTHVFGCSKAGDVPDRLDIVLEYLITLNTKVNILTGYVEKLLDDAYISTSVEEEDNE